MSHHTKPYTQITPRPLNALEAQEVERWLVYNAQRITQLDQYIKERASHGGTVFSQFIKEGGQ